MIKATAIVQIFLVSAFVVCVILFFLPNGILPSASDTVTVEKLIKQFEGRAVYWNDLGKQPGRFDSWTHRHFEMTGKITAARMLGEMGTQAKAAVPVLIEALQNGPNDIDTGDGVLRYRSTVATTLGAIGDVRAIGPLIEKLRVTEGPVVDRSHAGFHEQDKLNLPDGVGHEAVVAALGMFGPQAKAAVPFIKAVAPADDDHLKFGLREAVKLTLKQIEPSSHAE